MGLMPRIVCATAYVRSLWLYDALMETYTCSRGCVYLVLYAFCRYVKLKEKMKLLWDAEMRVNTVLQCTEHYGLSESPYLFPILT